MPAQAAMIRLDDDAGQILEFSQPPQRIISLTPHLTELLSAVGAGSQAVGVDSASDFPADVKKVLRVGDYSYINFERVVALKSDMVIVWLGGNRPVDIRGLKKLGVPVLQTQATRLKDVARLLRLIGQVSGHAALGNAAANKFSVQLAALEVPIRRPSRIKVFYQVWDRPLMTVGGAHWINDALSLCGARNVFDGLRGQFAKPCCSKPPH